MADKRFVAKNGLDNNSQTITNVAAPANASDAATKSYADGLVSDTAITAKLLTTYAVGANSALAAADTILAAFGKIQGQLNNKAASSHSHAISDVTGLQTALDGKAASSHSHAISDITGLQTALDGKAASSHTHTIANITGLQTALDGKAASSHTHAISDITGLQTALDGKAASSHSHAISDITGLQTALDGKASTGSLANYLLLTGGTLTGALSINTSAAQPLTVRRSGGGGSLGVTIDNVGTAISRAVRYLAIGDSSADLTGHAFYTRNGTATDDLRVAIYPAGTVVIGTDPGSSGLLRVGGDIRASGTIYATDFVLSGGAGGGTGLNLDNLDDVVITSPTTNQLLQYNGTNWVNATVSTGGTTVTVSNDTTTDAARYFTLSSATSGTISALNVSSTKLSFNPLRGSMRVTATGGFQNDLDDGGNVPFVARLTTDSTFFGAINQYGYQALAINIENSANASNTRGQVAFYTKTDGNWRKALRLNNGTPEDGAGNTLLHAGNYGSYALPLAGGTLTGTTYFSGANGGLQANYNGGVSFYGNEINSGANGVTGSLYIGQRNTNDVYVKGYIALHAGNYTSYSPSLTGSGASGTWGINITGAPGSDYTNGSYRVIADYGGGNTWYIRTSSPRFVFARGHDWTVSYELDISAGSSGANSAWATLGQITSNSANGTWRGLRLTQYSGSSVIDGDLRARRVYLGDDTNYIVQGGGGSMRSQTGSGWIEVGAQNGSFGHIQTDRPEFYFNKNLKVDGEVYQYGTNALHLHTGNYGNYAIMRGLGAAAYGDWGTFGNTQGGVYQVYQEHFNIGTNTGSSGFPSAASYKYGVVASLGSNDNARAQIYISHLGNDLVFRGGWGTGSWQTWNRVLTDQNHTSYSPSLTGSGASGTWSISVTGNAGSVTNGMYLSGDQTLSGVKTFYTPSGQTYNGSSGNIGLSVFNPAAGDAMITFHISNDYAGYFGLGGAENDLVWTGWSVGNSRHRILHSGNYTSWAPSLTGGGASGTWGINVTGNAATAGGLAVHGGTNNEVNKIVRTDGNGYVQFGWINTISGNMGTGNRLDRVWCSYDQYMRYLSLTEFKMQMGLSAKNSYQRHVDYTSDSNYWVGSIGHSGYGANEVFHGGSAFFDVWSGSNYPSGLSHIHGFNALHYTVNSLGSTGGNAYGIQVAGQYDQGGELWSRGCSGGSFSGWRRQLDSSNYNSYSPTLTGGGASGTWSINVTGNAGSASSVAASNITGQTGMWTSAARPGPYRLYRRDDDSNYSVQTAWSTDKSGYWSLKGYSGDSYHAPVWVGWAGTSDYATSAGSSGSTSNLIQTGYGNGTFTYYQTSGTFAGYSGWAGYLISNHGDGATYYNQTIITPFWSAPQYSRLEGGTFRGPYTFLSTENYSNYALPLSGGTISGNLGLGVAPDVRLSVNGAVHIAAANYLYMGGTAGSSGGWGSRHYTSSGNHYVNANSYTFDNVGYGSTWSVVFNGSGVTAPDFILSSDARLKTDLVPLDSAVKSLEQVSAYRYFHTKNQRQEVGVLAQEIREILPEAVTEDADGMLGVSYDRLVPLLLAAVKELSARVTQLENQH